MEKELFGKFEDIKYVRPDFKKAKAGINEVTKNMKNAKSYEEFRVNYRELEELMKEVSTMSTIASIRNTIDTTDKFYDEEVKYINKASGSLSLSVLKLTNVILKSKYKEDIKAEYGEYLIQDIEMSKKIMSPKIIFLMIKEGLLTQEYSKLAASCKTTFRGEECNFYGLLKHMQSTDREERKEAFLEWARLYEEVSGKLDDLYTKLIDLRVKVAKRLKFDSYTDYAYIARGRYDYKQEDVAKFREAVKKYIVPLCSKLYEEQRLELGIDKLHWYDEELTFKEGNAIPIGNEEELVQKAKDMYHELSKETGEFFDFMCEHKLFDLTTKPGKHLGGYCTFIAGFKAPFIFSNFNGTSADVDVLTHEAGHAFQAYLGSRTIELMNQMSSTSEINEIHSMSMEHFTYPFMDKFFGESVDKYRYHHLVKSLEVIPYLVSVDAFQHAIYANPKMDAMQRRKVWHDIEQEFMPWRDYDGNAFLSQGGFWMQKQHIFLYPFYYVDYALAQTCAYQFFLKGLDNFEDAFKGYISLCKAGGTKGYFALLKEANLDNPFNEETIKWVSEKISKVIEEFKSKL